MKEFGISPLILILVVISYFLVLFIISFITGRNSDTKTFFTANRSSPWYLVAFGMVGASLSGVTFISVPGWVAEQEFSYMQMVFGYLLGYFVIATVLMPLYYKLNLTSIYTYLEKRFGTFSYITGSVFFLISRVVGASFRLYLVAIVMQKFVMDFYGIPFWMTVLITIILIWVYTFKGGIKTIVWTDTLQTVCMLLAVVLTIFSLGELMNLSFGNIITRISDSDYATIFYFEGGWGDPKNFFKQFIGGASMAIVMTGLDQDMMQKNLTCKTIGDAQKNMFWFSIVLVIANLLFLSLGALLYIFAAETGIQIPETSDLLFPTIALQHLSPLIGIMFVLGLVAAAYSSADSALTALTTAFCVDILGFEKSNKSESSKKQIRIVVHLFFSILLFLTILVFYKINNMAVIKAIFVVACYTYGPLLGLFAFGLFSKRPILDQFAPIVCVLAPIITYFLNKYSEQLFFGYKFGFELVIVNGLLTFLGLYLLSIGQKKRS